MSGGAGVPAPPAFHPAPGVEYTETYGLKTFNCPAYRAILTAQSCAERYTKAQDARGDMLDRMAKCRTCATGAAHAGKAALRFSRYYKAERCSRCGRGGRIIGQRLCVSCANRQYELRKGVNARGTVPVELLQKPLRALRLQVEVENVSDDGVVTVAARNLRDPETISLVESIVQFLKFNTGVRAFGWAAPDVQRAAGRRPAREPGSLVASMVGLMAGRRMWGGNARELIAALREVGEDAWMSITPAMLGRQLRSRAPELGKAGIYVSGGKLEGGRWGIIVTNTRVPAEPVAEASPTAHPFVAAMVAMMSDRAVWTGGWDDLLAELAAEAAPATVGALAQVVRVRAEQLASAGIRVDSAPAGGANGKRLVTVRNARAIQDEPSAGDAADDGEPVPTSTAVPQSDSPRRNVCRYRAGLFSSAARFAAVPVRPSLATLR